MRRIIIDGLFKILAGKMTHNLAANLSAAFKQRHNRHLADFGTLSDSGLFSADIGFVNLNGSGKFVIERRVFQSKADSVRHEKRAAIAAQFQEPLQLKRTDSLFGTANQIPSNEPFAERNVAVLENCANGDGELLFAVGAPAQARTDFLGRIGRNRRKLGLVFAFAMRAKNAVLPADAFQMLTGGLIRGELVNNRHQRQIFGFRRFHGLNIAERLLFVKCIIPFKTGIAGWCAKNAFPPRYDWKSGRSDNQKL